MCHVRGETLGKPRCALIYLSNGKLALKPYENAQDISRPHHHGVIVTLRIHLEERPFESQPVTPLWQLFRDRPAHHAYVPRDGVGTVEDIQLVGRGGMERTE